jgi:O-antigen ligase
MRPDPVSFASPARGAPGAMLLLGPLVLVAVTAAAWKVVPDPLTPLLLAGGVAALVVAWIWPVVPPLACIAFSAFRLQEAYPILHPYQLPLLTAAWSALALGGALLRRDIRATPNRLFAAIGLLVVWTSIAAMLSSDRAASMAFWSDAYVKLVFVALALALLVRTDGEFALLRTIIIACGAGLAVAAIWNHAIGSQLVEGTRVTIGRDLGSPLGDPNDLAMMLAMALSFALVQVAAARGSFRKILAIAASILILGAISLTQSRGGLLAVAAVFLVIGWRQIPSRTAMICLCILGVLGLFVMMDIGSRVSGGRAEEGFGESAEIRLELWKIALRQVTLHPVFGIGPMTFHTIAGEFTGHAITVHNSWMQIAVEAGLPALAAFAVAVLAMARTNAEAAERFGAAGNAGLRATALGAQGMLAAYGVAGLFLSQGFNWSLFTVMATVLALRFRLDGDPS